MESQLRKALYEYEMIEDSNVTVALSGGKDSMSLLHLLSEVSGRGFPKLKLSAVHVSGAYSCGAGVNLRFIEEFCRERNVELVVREVEQDLETLECYSCSRKRRKAIFDAAKELGSTTIAFGHHRDDNAQTLLMNLLHKGEFAGNLPKIKMVHYGVTIIRPLIYVSEADIRSYARKKGFERITCRCPVGQNSLRKKVDRMLDEWETVFPNARGNIASASLTYGSKKAEKI